MPTQRKPGIFATAATSVVASLPFAFLTGVGLAVGNEPASGLFAGLSIAAMLGVAAQIRQDEPSRFQAAARNLELGHLSTWAVQVIESDLAAAEGIVNRLRGRG